MKDDELQSIYPGMVSSERIVSLRPDVGHSLTVKHHRSVELVGYYSDGIAEASRHNQGNMVCRDDGSVFTLSVVDTKPSWPGPMTFYSAQLQRAVEDNPVTLALSQPAGWPNPPGRAGS